MMTMTMSLPHCRDHGLSGAGRTPATRAAAPFWASPRAITPIRLLSVPVWVCVHEGRFGRPARTESVPQPEQKAKSEAAGGTRSHRIRKRAGWDVSPACVPSFLCAHVRAVITPRRRHYPSRRRHLLHHGSFHDPRPVASWAGICGFHQCRPVSRSGPSQQPWPRYSQRTSLTSVPWPWPPRATQKSQTLYSMPDPLRAMRAASLNETLTEAARSSAPSALCRRSGALGSPSRPHTPRMNTALQGGWSTAGPADSTDATRRSEETTEPACPQSSRNGAAAHQAR